jgi:hypothetical protein
MSDKLLAMDLRSGYPRSPRERLGGYVHLARMIDKCRAKVAGMIGDYIYPCPLDQRLLDFAGIDPDQLLDQVRQQSEEAVVRWWTATAKLHSNAEREDWNRELLARGPDSDEKWVYFCNTRDRINPTRSDIVTWADLLDLEEGRPVPRRATSIG